MDVSIIVISLPAIRLLLSQMWPGMLSTQNTQHPSSAFGRSTPKSPASILGATKSQHAMPGLYSMRSVAGAHENESQLELGGRRNGMTETAVGIGHGHVGRVSAGSGAYVMRDTVTQPTRPWGTMPQ